MTLLEVLEANTDRLPARARRAVAFLERKWAEKGRPLEPDTLQEFLDSELKFCSEVELRYPGFYLRRLKQLQRGEWQPRGPGSEV
jgi:hypothetical protein